MDHTTTDSTITYAQWVSEQTKRIPSLSTVADFFERDSSRSAPNNCQIVCHLAFSDPKGKGPVPLGRPLNAANLQTFLTTPGNFVNPRPDGTVAGRILTIEDPSKDVVEILGRTLNIDPSFFGGHIETARVDIERSRTSMATLPSNAAKQDFVNITYQKALVFPESGPDKPPVRYTGTLLRSTNVPRKLAILPRNKESFIGLVKHCCSVLKIKSKTKNGPWLAIVLVDAAIEPTEKYLDGITGWDLTSHPFQGGFADYDDTPRYTTSTSNNPSINLNRNSMLDAVSLYWEKGYPPAFNTADPTLLSLCYHPLKIVASEWMTYLEVMFHAIKKYEYSPDKLKGKDSIEKEVQKMHGDLKSVQAWCRRSEQSYAKVKAVVEFLESHNHTATVPDKDEPASSSASSSTGKSSAAPDSEIKSALLMDFQYIAGKIAVYGRTLENSVTIVTSLIQIADNRLSFAETLNVNRLTNIALIFVPLSYVSGLFAMSDKVAPSREVIWVYITVALPILLIVLFLSQKSKLAKWFDEKFPKSSKWLAELPGKFTKFPRKFTELSKKFSGWRKKCRRRPTGEENPAVSDATSTPTINQKQVDTAVP